MIFGNPYCISGLKYVIINVIWVSVLTPECGLHVPECGKTAGSVFLTKVVKSNTGFENKWLNNHDTVWHLKYLTFIHN